MKSRVRNERMIVDCEILSWHFCEGIKSSHANHLVLPPVDIRTYDLRMRFEHRRFQGFYRYCSTRNLVYWDTRRAAKGLAEIRTWATGIQSTASYISMRSQCQILQSSYVCDQWGIVQNREVACSRLCMLRVSNLKFVFRIGALMQLVGDGEW